MGPLAKKKKKELFFKKGLAKKNGLWYKYAHAATTVADY
jgi:hypothetical protein